jgi:hypothetical protein
MYFKNNTHSINGKNEHSNHMVCGILDDREIKNLLTITNNWMNKLNNQIGD